MPFARRENKEPPSSDAETDKMEGIDDRDSQLEIMSNGKRSLNVTVSSPTLKKTNGLNHHNVDNDDDYDQHLNKKQKVVSVNDTIDKENNNDEEYAITDKDNTAVELNAINDDNDAEGEDDEGDDEDETKEEEERDNKMEKDGEKGIDHTGDDDVNQNKKEVKTEKNSEGGNGEREGEGESHDEGRDTDAEIDEKEKEEQRNNAMNGLKNIEIKFAKLKDKLYETQLTKLEFELKLCENNQHPDLIDYMKMVDEDFKKKTERLMNLQKYKLKCLDNQTRANRISLHQQFLKLRQDLKTNEIVKITTDWYDINKERRMMDMETLNLPDYYQFNQLINEFNINQYVPILTHQRNSVFKELSILQGLINYKQIIPSSLNNLSGCSENEIDSDLKELGIKMKKEV